MLEAHPLLRVAVPLEDDQLQFAGGDDALDPDAGNSTRIIAAATGLVYAKNASAWPSNVKPPQHWLWVDLPGLVPGMGGSSDERDVRTRAWLAFLRHADLIMWGDALPTQTQSSEPADPTQLIWFYPGQWFGVQEPVPTIELKWLRRAEQDYEYLKLASDRGMSTNALMLARLITKQVRIAPGTISRPGIWPADRDGGPENHQ